MKKKIQLLVFSLKPGKEIQGQRTILLFLGFSIDPVNKFISDFESSIIQLFDFEIFSLKSKKESKISINRDAIDSYIHIELEAANQNDSMENAADQLNMIIINLYKITDLYLFSFRENVILYKKDTINKIFLENSNNIKELQENVKFFYESREKANENIQILIDKYNALYDDYIKIINKYNELNHKSNSYTREIESLKFTNYKLEKSSEIQQEKFEQIINSRKIICPKCNGTGTVPHFNSYAKRYEDNGCPVCRSTGRVNEYD